MPITTDTFTAYWSDATVAINVIIVLNICGALILGLILGYERSFHGRAAGMRTYGMVCMASCAITVVTGYPTSWFGSLAGHAAAPILPADPTRVIQGIVTGIGFLGAGVIMKDRMNISGLTTAASIWAASGIGILVGVGFYAAAILVTLLSSVLMIWGTKLENWLPARKAFAVSMQFKRGFMPEVDILRQAAADRGFELAAGSLEIDRKADQFIWRCLILVNGQRKDRAIADISKELEQFDGVEEFQVSHARN